MEPENVVAKAKANSLEAADPSTGGMDSQSINSKRMGEAKASFSEVAENTKRVGKQKPTAKKPRTNQLNKLKDNLKRVIEPSKEQLDSITDKLEQVYKEWSAEACGQILRREDIASEFEEFVNKIDGCENITVELFGSTCSRFALKDSDINMMLISKDGKASNYFKVMSSICKCLIELAESREDAVYYHYEDNLYSTVSHISFVHRRSDLQCHVRYGSKRKEVVWDSKLLRLYGEVDHRVKVLIVAFKYWAKLCQLNVQTLGSYPSQMFVLMVVHFLQQVDDTHVLPILKLPNNFKLQFLEDEKKNFTKLENMIKSWKVTNMESIGMLWFKLFRFYCNEDYLCENVVQVTKLEPQRKQDYYSPWFRRNKRLVVCSPFHPCYNIGNGSYSQKMYEYMKICLKKTLVYFGGTAGDEKTKVAKLAANSTADDKSMLTLKGDLASDDKSDTLNDSSPNLKDIAGEAQEHKSDRKTEKSLINRPIKSDVNDDKMLLQSIESCDTGSGSHYHDTSHDQRDGNGTTVDAECTINLCSRVGTSGDIDLQYDFVDINFVLKELPDVCSVCKQEGHIQLNCPCKEEDVKIEKFSSVSSLLAADYNLLEILFTDLKQEICLKPDDDKKRKDICTTLQRHIGRWYPGAELMLFGSSANGFGTSSSDVDISINLPNSFKLPHKKIIKAVGNILRFAEDQDDWQTNSVEPIVDARVPIVKLLMKKKWDGLECDISVGNKLALKNTTLLSSYASIDDRVTILVLALKRFTKFETHCICDATYGFLSSYAYILLMLHYLQQVKPPVVPVLQQIGTPTTIDVNGWNCWFFQFDNPSQLEKAWPYVKKNKSSVGELWVNFFKYYFEEFDWKRDVVTIRQLELKKIEKEWASKQVCIEDPFNLDQNLSYHLKPKYWRFILDVFKCAYDHFTNPRLYYHQLTIDKLFSVQVKRDYPKDGKCNKCGKRGHLRWNCYKSHAKPKPESNCSAVESAEYSVRQSGLLRQRSQLADTRLRQHQRLNSFPPQSRPSVPHTATISRPSIASLSSTHQHAHVPNSSKFVTHQMKDRTIDYPAPPSTTTATTNESTVAEDSMNVKWKKPTDDKTSGSQKEKWTAKHMTWVSPTTSLHSVGKSSLGKPVTEGTSTRRGGRSRPRTSRDTSSTHSSKTEAPTKKMYFV